jgi:lysylphosphatidylglycerol synthetase-like protein (DUF2156 family)
MSRSQPQLDISKFLDTRFFTLLLAIMGIAMFVGGLYLIIADKTLPLSADTARSTSFFAVQIVVQILGYPLPTNEMISDSISAVGIATLVVSLDVLIISLGLWFKSKLALWIAMIVIALAAYFDFVSFLYQGLMGAPASAPGVIINGLMIYVLMRDRESFKGISTPKMH